MNRYEINNGLMSIANVKGKLYPDLLTYGNINH